MNVERPSSNPNTTPLPHRIRAIAERGTPVQQEGRGQSGPLVKVLVSPASPENVSVSLPSTQRYHWWPAAAGFPGYAWSRTDTCRVSYGPTHTSGALKTARVRYTEQLERRRKNDLQPTHSSMSKIVQIECRKFLTIAWKRQRRSHSRRERALRNSRVARRRGVSFLFSSLRLAQKSKETLMGVGTEKTEMAGANPMTKNSEGAGVKTPSTLQSQLHLKNGDTRTCQILRSIES